MGKSDPIYNSLAHVRPALKGLVTLFLMVMTIGFGTGLSFINYTTSGSAQGIVEQYNGNEDDEDAEEMKFKKSKHAMLNILHTHIISMSLVFFVLALLVYASPMPDRLKVFLIYEPLLSVLLTFGGIYFIWNGFPSFTYLVMLSGGLMTVSYFASIALIWHGMWWVDTESEP